MGSSLSSKVGWYLNFYQEFLVDWWQHITYWEYILVMVACLGAGWVMLRRPIHGFE